MAEELLITRRRSIAGLFLDATVEERYTSKNAITQNPVEYGASVTDHRIRLPDKYIVSGRVSDTPLLQSEDDRWNNGTEETRSKSAWALLNELKNNGNPFIIESGLQRYDDMLIETLTSQQSSANANVLDFVAECTQVIIVETQDVVVDFPEPGTVEEQAIEEADLGNVQAETPTEETNTSWGVKIAELLGVVN